MTDDVLDTWTAPGAPARVKIAGAAGCLEPLDARVHGADLWTAFAGNETIWRYMAYGPFESQAVFLEWLDSRTKPDDPLTFAIVDTNSGQARGLIAMMAIRPEMGVVEIGHIVFAPALQKTKAATEAIYLVLKHLFDLGYRRVEWKCDARNGVSKRAAKRFGFLFEGLFHQHMVVKAESRDSVWFAMLDHEWPAVKTAFEGWLAPVNFNAAGMQLRPLVSFMPD